MALLESEAREGFQSASSPRPLNMAFEEFCGDTGLHGWKFVSKSKHPLCKTLWLFITVSSIGVAGLFIHTAVQDFVSATGTKVHRNII